ncbi:hypothetical protein CEXT_392201 [Caerostris extrusa]|uniref:Uncharacterized protein n=1 Tax=Caerostris extrusa TaxID=172846 RepID=A0AAV4R3P3_CAEEX|nr:hypothetical protein CEXT_392201 [Caerostris extrusa]
MPKPWRSKSQREYPWSHLVDSILTRDKKFNRRNGKVIYDAVKTRIEINNLMNKLQKCKPVSPTYESTYESKKLSEQLENRLIRVNLKVKQIPEHMGVLEEIFSTFGIKTSDLEETKPTPPKETAPSTDQVDNYKPNLRVVLKDNTTYPNSSEELQALLIAKNIIPNSSTEVAPNQITPTTGEVIMDTSEEPQNEPSPTEEPYQIPPKRLTCRDQTQDPKTQGPEIKNQYSPLIQMDTENSTAMSERKKQMPPFFITPNASWPETCKVLTSTVESLNISLSKDHSTKECKLQPDAERKCVNCQGSHAAFYRGCPNFPRRNPPQQKRIYPTPPQKPRTKISLEENPINRQISPEGGKRTYANIIKNQNEQAHLSTNIPSKLPTNPTEVDLFSTLLKLIPWKKSTDLSPANSLQSCTTRHQENQLFGREILYHPGEVWSFPALLNYPHLN